MRSYTQQKPKRLKVCPHCGSILPRKEPRPPAEEGVELTDQQTKVLKGIARGLTCAQIGEELGLSRRTVEFHRMMVMQRLRLKSTAALALYAANHGLI